MAHLNLRGAVVVVTGASSGVGRAIAREFGRKGARVGLIARNEEALRNCAGEIRACGGDALVLPLDVASSDEVDAAAQKVVDTWGRIDVWVNDAMVTVFSPVLQMKPEEFRRVTEVTYLGTVYGTLAALRHMHPRQEGHIIQIGSALAYRSIPLQSAYCAAKAAIRGFTDSLRCELIHDRSPIHLSMPQLPAVNTPQFDQVLSRLPHRAQPVPPIYQPEVIARTVVRLAQHPKREAWLAWSSAKAILGQRLIPGLLDAFLGRKAYGKQQTDEPRPERPHNLWHPVPGDRGAHGRFDDRSRGWSSEALLSRHRGILAASLGAAALCGGVYALRR